MGAGGLPARKRPLTGIKALMGMLTISIMAELMSDRDFWRCVLEPRYGARPVPAVLLRRSTGLTIVSSSSTES